jgi:hypothetical protein
VCAVVLTYDAINETEVEALETVMQDIQAQIKTFREMASRVKVEAGKK